METASVMLESATYRNFLSCSNYLWTINTVRIILGYLEQRS